MISTGELLKGMKNIFSEEDEVIKEKFNEYFYNNYANHFANGKSVNNFLCYIRDLFRLCSANRKIVLDIGCGFGVESALLRSLGACHVYGINYNRDELNVAKKLMGIFNLHSSNIDFILGNANHLPFEDKSFDSVFCLESISHIRDFDVLMSEIKRVLKGNGFLVIRDGNNALNPVKNVLTRRLHRKSEYGPLSGTGIDVPYSKTREVVIKKISPQIDVKNLTFLVKNTRGMWGEEIEKAVKQFLTQGEISEKTRYRCVNPSNGEVQEHLFNPIKLKRHIASMGFRVRVIPDILIPFHRYFKKWESLTRIAPVFSLILAPAFIILAKKTK